MKEGFDLSQRTCSLINLQFFTRGGMRRAKYILAANDRGRRDDFMQN